MLTLRSSTACCPGCRHLLCVPQPRSVAAEEHGLTMRCRHCRRWLAVYCRRLGEWWVPEVRLVGMWSAP